MPFGAEYAELPRWSRLQRWYIRTFGIVDLPGRLRARLVLRELRGLETGTILDVGPGTGSYSLWLSRNSEVQVHAVEIDRRRVGEGTHMARALGRRNLRFRLGSADRDLRLVAPGSMDVVLAIEVLQYCRDVPSVVSESFRVLKPGGRFVAHVPALGCLRPSETTLFTEHSLRELCALTGFVISSLRPTFGPGQAGLCRLFERVSPSALMTAVIFPFLMLASLLTSPQTASGDYLLLHARKPAGRADRENTPFR